MYIDYHLHKFIAMIQSILWNILFKMPFLKEFLKSVLDAFIPQAMNELKAYGFQYFCTYDKMKPIFREL